MITLFSKDPKRVVKILFKTNGVMEEPYDFPLTLPTPNIGEYIWVDVFRQGKVMSVDHKLGNNVYITTIHVSQFI